MCALMTKYKEAKKFTKELSIFIKIFNYKAFTNKNVIFYRFYWRSTKKFLSTYE